MRPRFMLLVCGFLLLTLLLPFQAAAESGSPVVAESLNSGVTMVAGGTGHTLDLKQNGTVWAWGNNEYGQLGDGTTTDHHFTPVQVQGLDSVSEIAAGDSHSLALKSDGTVWAWGSVWGMGSKYSPVQVSDLSSVVAIASGHYHNLAVKSDGTVWAWGRNIYGELGDGSRTDRNTPVQVQGLGSVVDVAAGHLHSLALKSDGTVWAWGINESGQNGVPGGLTFYDGPYTTNYRHTPVQVEGLSSVVAIAAGYSHSLAVKSDGTVWAWGDNSSGELGDGSTTTRYTPVQVTNLGSVTDIAAGSSHTLALKSDGTVWTWGHNYSGQLGDGSTTSSSSPVQVSELDSVYAIATNDGSHSLAVKSDGTVWAWGNNSLGQLGDGTTINRYTPVQVANPEAPQWPEYDVLTVTDVTYNSVQLNWQHATDETSIDKYLVYQDNTLLATLNGDVISYEVKGLSPNSSYLFSLIAVDADGNQSVKKEETVTTAANNPVPEAETLLYRFNGTILDFDQSRIIWKETGDKSLWMYNRADKSQVKVYDANGSNRTISTAKLSADGVVYSISGTGTHYWKDGAVQNSWDTLDTARPYEVKGNFAVFGHNVVNVKTRESRSLLNSSFKNRNSFDLSADGTVVYEFINGIRYHLPDDTFTTFNPPSPEYPNTYNGPLTDGKNILYNAYTEYEGYSKWSLQVRSADGQVTKIALNPIDSADYYNTDPRTSYQINNGWIAYKEYNKEIARWTLKVRSPEGETKQAYTAPKWWQLTGVPLSIKQLGPDGTVAFTFKDTTYLYSAQEGKLLYSFSGPGELHYQDGIWYRIDGGSLYQVDPNQLQLSDSKTYQTGGSNYEYSLYYGYISSPGQELSGSWSPPEGFHGVVKVSMVSPEGEDYDLSLETVGEGNRLPEDTTLLTNGTEYSATEVPGGYRAEWRVKGHTGNDYSRDKKVFVYVSIKYDNH
ncbi:fibronectin type III domain-containing protein [Paenibacillus sp. LHD-38]|uniref:RCC1 domain-containing protein n=1 Tax=Paenibacillus sp. LHD-38 TaxID=3072143 RepID=UPI0028108706|nr:fibronectin type III domain-containing protein [Paenibacillus sp. LHD-38]MDQ8734335.1 fibronectin type III domain-containing protein [Paenibacillus sp. LHD-38]